MSRTSFIGPRPAGAWQPGEEREEWAKRQYRLVREQVQSIPRIERAYYRGDSDAYYGRINATPCIWDDGVGSVIIPYADMTKQELAAYYRGYSENPSGQKEWD